MIKTSYMTGMVSQVDTESSITLRVKGDDGREYVCGKFEDYIDLDQSLRPPPVYTQGITFDGKPWINKRVDFEYAEFRNQLLILRFINLKF